MNIQEIPLLTYRYVDAVLIREVEQQALEKGRRLILQAAEVLQQVAVPHQLHVLAGAAAETIARQAEALGCDAVVMGKRGLGSLSGLLLGSVATKVINLVHVPVTIVK